MKKIICVLGLFVATTISGCFELATETTINEDGSGVYTSSTDMGNIIAMLKMMGDDAKELDSLKKDTVISLAYLKDSLAGISETQKRILTNATLRVIFDISEEKMLLNFSFPFDKISEMAEIDGILTNSSQNILNKQLEFLVPKEENEAERMDLGADQNSIPNLDKYFDYTYEKGKLSKKINQAKYAELLKDPMLKNMKEMGQMGNPMSLKTVFNLPRAVKKAEGIGLTLSADKKKITIETTIDDLFDQPEKLEYEIEY